jgi:hypothetical protein
VLLSDQTPWQDLEEYKAGWVVPLSKTDKFCEIIEMVGKISHEEYLNYSDGAIRYAHEISNNKKIIEQNRNLFYHAMV